MPITLPTQKTLPKMSLRDMTVLIYAAPKFGKSTWASQAPDALFLATEPGPESSGLLSATHFQLGGNAGSLCADCSRWPPLPHDRD